jgi:hypothetical protein
MMNGGGMVVTIFFSYAHSDERFRDKLETHLATLKREGVITWHDRRMAAGDVLDHAISRELEKAQIILLLVSPDFLDSTYCYEREMARALERQREGTATAIPVILRPCDWQTTPLGQLLAAPLDGKPISQFEDQDAAFAQVAKAVRQAVERQRRSGRSTAESLPSVNLGHEPLVPSSAPSGHLRLKREFSDYDKDTFLEKAFLHIEGFFANSLAGLQDQHGVETKLQRRSDDMFSAVIYANGRKRASCTLWQGDRSAFGGICYVNGETTARNRMNESLSIDSEGDSLSLRPTFGLATWGGQTDRMSVHEAAEYLWGVFIRQVQ